MEQKDEKTMQAPTQEGNTAKQSSAKRYLLFALLIVAGVLLTSILYFTIKPLIETWVRGSVAQSMMAVGLIATAALAIYLAVKKKLTLGWAIALACIAAYILRVGYILYTAGNARQYDTFSPNFDGHEAYAWTIFSTGKLPDSNVYQFYHPPLNALLQAGFMHVVDGLTSGLSELFSLGDYFPSAFAYSKPEYLDERRYFLYSSCQILSLVYSMLAVVGCIKLVLLFPFSNQVKGWLCLLVAIFPRGIQLAGQLNNDVLSFALGIWALYFALKWQKQGKGWLPIILCALCVGLGLMTKLSTATICLPIAGVFIYEFICTVFKKEGSMPLSKMIAQYAVFLAIGVPVGLWFQVYAKVRFDQNFGFVFSNLNHALYTGDYSLFERFVFPFSLKELFGSLYCRPFDYHHYLFGYALRSAIFGEFGYYNGEGFATAALLFGAVASAVLLVGVVWSAIVCIKDAKGKGTLIKKIGVSYADFLFAFLLVQSQVIGEVYFYLQMPYGCTMDFRYILPMIAGVALTIGLVERVLAAEGGTFSKALRTLLYATCGTFLAASTLFYCVCI